MENNILCPGINTEAAIYTTACVFQRVPFVWLGSEFDIST